MVDGVEVTDASAPAQSGSLVQIGQFTLKLADSGLNLDETVLAPRQNTPQRLTLERDLRRVLIDGKVVVERLSKQEFQFIETLVDASPAIVQTSKVGDVIWGEGQWDVYMLHNLVRRIRRKFEENGFEGEILENIPGSGLIACLVNEFGGLATETYPSLRRPTRQAQRWPVKQIGRVAVTAGVVMWPPRPVRR